MNPIVKGFYDTHTFSVQYVVTCPRTRQCAIIDPVFDFDERSGATATTSADAILAYVADAGLKIEWILDTHPHADHISGVAYLHDRTDAPMGIGRRISEMQKIWQSIYAWPELRCDGSQWNRLFAPDDTFRIGDVEARVIASPGHTLASITYVVGDAAFIHDTLFMPDTGTARADFPGGSSGELYDSIMHLFELPDATRVFTGHDYREGGREVRFESTIGAQKATNIHFAPRPTRDAYIALRDGRDHGLPMPRLILHALQANLQGGRLPAPDAEGRRFLKIPLDALPTKGLTVPTPSKVLGGH